MSKEEKKPHGMNQYKKVWATLNAMKAKDEIIEARVDSRMGKVEKELISQNRIHSVQVHELSKRVSASYKLAFTVSAIALLIAIVAFIIAL